MTKLLICRDPNMGDAICAIPAMHALSLREDFHLIMANQAVAKLLPGELARFLSLDIPNGKHDVITIGAWPAVQKYGWNIHPTVSLMALAGLEATADVMQPRIKTHTVVPAFDYVVAPFTKDEADRGWDMHSWRDLLTELRRRGTVAIVCGASDAAEALPFDEVYRAHQLETVACLMKRARRAVITLDSGPSRLAHAAGVKNHVLLCSDVVPMQWAKHPGAEVVYAKPRAFEYDAVIDAIMKVEATWTLA